MARGMVNGEAIVSQANSKEYADNYDRIFGKDHKPQRGHWSFGSADDSEKAINAPVMVDRFYEGTVATDGTDIGSRRKRNEYMKANGLAPADDYSPGWYESRRTEMKRDADRQRRETLERALYQQRKP